MKIAYILSTTIIVSGRSNGIRSQAETWADNLRRHGHVVDYVSEWGDYDWKSYDAIHLFGEGEVFYYAVLALHRINPHIHWSPICDPDLGFNYAKSRIRSIVSKATKGYVFHEPDTYKLIPLVEKIFVRTNFEKEHLKRVYNIEESKFELVPLSYSNFCAPFAQTQKEDLCLHISSIFQPRKNVIRLIEAARKYNFRLILAGNKGNERQFEPLRRAIGDAENIEVLGFVSEEEKIDLYQRAKVFALPSIKEGVGIVALDAAYYGCEVVMTGIPGPKEYYDGRCVEVNPMSVDEIGIAVISLMNGEKHFQPELKAHIGSLYSPDTITEKLINCYRHNS